MTPLTDLRDAYVRNQQLRSDEWRNVVRQAWTAGAVAMMTNMPEPKRQKYRGVSAFLRRLAAEGGSIVSTAALTPDQIAEARTAGRLHVLADGFGFVILPPSTAGVPDTKEADRG